MTPEERAAAIVPCDGDYQDDGASLRQEILEHIEAAIADEREACANIADHFDEPDGDNPDEPHTIAEAIRARGKP